MVDSSYRRIIQIHRKLIITKSRLKLFEINLAQNKGDELTNKNRIYRIIINDYSVMIGLSSTKNNNGNIYDRPMAYRHPMSSRKIYHKYLIDMVFYKIQFYKNISFVLVGSCDNR